MSAELIAILAVGVAVAGLVLNGQRAARQDNTSLGERLDKRIDSLDKRIDSLDKRLDDLDGRLRAVEHGLAKLEGLLEGLREAIAGRTAA